jgi:hypothetical protein
VILVIELPDQPAFQILLTVRQAREFGSELFVLAVKAERGPRCDA